jgi:hypothetical protein
MHDTRDHPPVIDTCAPGWFFGKCGSIAAHAASDNQNNDPAMAQPPPFGGTLNQQVGAKSS